MFRGFNVIEFLVFTVLIGTIGFLMYDVSAELTSKNKQIVAADLAWKQQVKEIVDQNVKLTAEKDRLLIENSGLTSQFAKVNGKYADTVKQVDDLLQACKRPKKK